MRARASHVVLDVGPHDADFVVRGRIEPRPGGFRTVFILQDGSGHQLGERTFDATARSCRALDESLTLALEMLVDTPRLRELALAARGDRTESAEHPAPVQPEAKPEPPSAPHPGSGPRPSPRPPARPSPAKPPPRNRPWEIDLGLGASASGGFAPRPTIGPTVQAMLHPPGFVPISLRGTLYPFAVDRVTVPGEGIAVRGFVAGLDLCPLALARGRFTGLACAGVDLAGIHAEPLGPRSNAGDLLFPLLPLRAEMRAHVGGLTPYAAFTMRFSPTSPEFIHEAPTGEDRVSFREPRATVALELGFVWRLPAKK